MACKLHPMSKFYIIAVLMAMAIAMSVEGAWNNLIGSWSDSEASWTGSIPYEDSQWHYGPARLWTSPVNTDYYVISSRVQVLDGKGCGHMFKYKKGSVLTRSHVTKAWGYFFWGGSSMYITSSGPEGSPRIDFSVTSNTWYVLKSVVSGTQVKIYVNNKLVKEITMSGSGADAMSDNYVGLWCHNKIPIKGASFQVQVQKCPALTVGRLVKTSPSRCVTSQVEYNTNCSLSCPQGYQLQGPSYKQCRANGQWTDSVKAVSCNDVNECLEFDNGGCSHKCVNALGGYKCECQDPELRLSSDDKTCHAQGVDINCNSNNMSIIIPKSLLRGMDRQHLRLLNTTCKATETSTHFSLTTPLSGCKTTRRQTPTAIVYSNAVLEIPMDFDDVVTRVRKIEIPFSCLYSNDGMVSSVGWKSRNRRLVFSKRGQGNYTLSLNMFPDKRFTSPYTNGDFPVSVALFKLLFFEVSVTSDDKQLSIVADRCYATPTQDLKNPLKYEFIKKGCPNDITVRYLAPPSVSAQRFSLEAFEFIADHSFVFVHCHVIICNATDPGSKCAKKCPSSGRGRREVLESDHMNKNAYSVALGPLHLTREKRGEKSGSSLERSGSSLPLMVALFVMSVACLAGTALMIFKKSRDKAAGYAVLTNGEQK